MNDPSQIELNDPPKDGITNLTFHPSDPSLLLVSSWDKTLRIYNVETNRLVQQFTSESAILDCCFGDDDVVFYGGLDRKVKMIQLTTGEQTVLGEHQGAISCVCWGSVTKKLFTGSWDKTLCIWDPHQPSACLQQIDLQRKVFSMDLKDTKLAIALSDRKTLIYDIRDMTTPWQTRDTTLRYQLKCVRLMPNGQGYVCSSIEGRVAIEYFDMAEEVQFKRYAFKSHRQTINDTEVVYPVNSLAFHPKYGTFASGGSDCVVNIWDGAHRKRIKNMAGYPDEIASLAFNQDGTKLAIASSYTFDEGERDHAPDAIYIKQIQDTDVAPRNVTQ
ncbi:WD40-repeat-containing domain protein [Choanephora cucurbitarum]|nr:WD40-repeat-containing domain protein [Choanephora cucurbitarum]